MQLHDLVKPLEELSDEELMEKIRRVRTNRTVERPAGKARAKRTAKKATTSKVKKVSNKLNIGAFSDEQRAQLIALLKAEGNGNG